MILKSKLPLWLCALGLIAVAGVLYIRHESNGETGEAVLAVSDTATIGASPAPANVPTIREDDPFVEKPIEEHSRAFRRDAIPTPRLDQENFARVLSAWRERGNSSPSDLFALWRVVNACAEFDQQAMKAKQGVDAQLQPAVNADPRPKRCELLTTEELAARFNLLEASANAGDLHAQLAYVINGSPLADDVEALTADGEEADRFKRNAVRFLESAAQSGSAEALTLLAGAYEVGVLVPQDASTSFAYTYAASMTGLTGRRSLVDLKAKELNPQQLTAGKLKAQEIYSACCAHK